MHFCWKFVMLFSCVILDSKAKITCGDIPELRPHKKLSYSEITTLHNTSLIRCLKECLLRSLCKSINFDFTKFKCDLNREEAREELGKVDASTSIFSFNILNTNFGARSTCKDDEKSFITRGKHQACIKIGCLPPPQQQYPGIKARFTTPLAEFGSYLTYECESNNNVSLTLLCKNDGTWAKTNNTVTCPSPHVSGNKYHVHIVLAQSYTYERAKNVCEARGGSLFTPQTFDRIIQLGKLVHNQRPGTFFWIDGRYSQQKDAWMTSKYIHIPNVNHTKRLNGVRGPNTCAAIQGNGHRLTPHSCTKSFGYICE